MAEGRVEDDEQGQNGGDREEAGEKAEKRGGRRDRAVPEGANDGCADLGEDAEQKDGRYSEEQKQGWMQ